jgi:cytosine/adenosine deaminase-related metal-dependent hydrolase
MRLNNLRFPGGEELYDIWIRDDRIIDIRPARLPGAPSAPSDPSDSSHSSHSATSSDPTLDFNGALTFPGLINSHDHLDFNLFPPLGNRKYNNYTEWGADIQANNRASIDPILAVPQALRTQWGIYKNLLNGFTAVVNHGEYLEPGNPPITVFQDCYCLHSVGFEPRWKWRLNHPGKTGRPFVLLVGEGTDLAANREIDQLIRWNLFRRPLIGIHGVAMTEQQAASFHALVWCPASNYFLLGRTAAIDRLHTTVPVLFGTDSTLTAGWNAWAQIRLARKLGLVADSDLLAMLTANPANTWDLEGQKKRDSGRLTDRGTLAPGKIADLVIARPAPGLTGMDAFFSLNPEDLLFILHKGQIRLFDGSLLGSITEQRMTREDFQPTRPGGKYVVGDLPGLMQEIRRYRPDIFFPALP